MPPHQGSGAGQAIEVSRHRTATGLAPAHYLSPSDQDAYILASILGDASVTHDSLPDALRAYEHVRRPFANHVLEASTHAGRLCELRGGPRDDEVALAPALQNQWGWVGGEDPNEQLERALRWMHEARE
jgi:salicylate hydroxylase